MTHLFFKKGKTINISIIIPVCNEKTINDCLEKIINNKTLNNYEIIVVDGNGTSTIDTVKFQNITKISSKKGRANQMNEGAKYASSNILLFLHADTILPNNALVFINKSLSDKNISAGAFDLSFDTHKKSLKFIAFAASWRSRLTRLPYGDQAIFIKKEVFDRVGTYENILLMEDVNLMQKLKIQNFKIKILKLKIVTSARKWEKSGLVFTTLRNLILLGLYLIGVHPNKLAKYYK